MGSEIFGLVIPKYGMVMTEGRISKWYVDVGDTVSAGDELVDIETEKVANVYESPYSGVLRRKLVADGQSAPIGAPFGIISALHVQDAEIDSFVEHLRAACSPEVASPEGSTAEVVGVQGGYIRFLKRGDNDEQVVVLIHGFGGDLNNWILNQNALADARSVYALDLPGHGGSVKSPDIATIGDLATAVVGFLDARGLSGVHLVGHSLGGGVAVRTAATRPKQIASLSLLAPIGLGGEINSTFIQALVETDRRKEMHAVLERLFHDPRLVTRDMTMNVLKSKRIDGAVSSLRAIAGQCFSGGGQSVRLGDELRSLPMPVQIIWGMDDQIIPPSHTKNLPRQFKIHMIENAGHMVHLEKAAEINRLISEFISAG